DRPPRTGQDAVYEEHKTLPQRFDLSDGFSDLATELELRVLQSGGGPRGIGARGVGEAVLLAPRPDRETHAHEGGEEVRKVEAERDRPVPIARRERKVGTRFQPLDLNCAGEIGRAHV